SDTLLLEDGNAPSKVRQGVTTEVLGEGTSAGPYPVAPVYGVRTGRFRALADYFNYLKESKVAVNLASYVGLDIIWPGVWGTSSDRPPADQFAGMKSLMDATRDTAASGLSTMPMMPPAPPATTDDIADLDKVGANPGGTYSSHIRNEGTGVFDSVKE